MSTRTRALTVGHGLALFAALATVTLAVPGQASPWSAPSSVSLRSQPAEPASVDAALESGDLSSARQLAEQAREAEPSAATWQQQGQVLEQSGDYRGAAKAYREASKAAGDDVEAAAAADEGLARVLAASRGTVADEPESTHREALDERWNPKPKVQPDPTPEPAPVDVPPPERIVTKWYFWVTVGAIAASAAAVTAIAIRAARDDQGDALDSLTRAPPPRGPGVLRF
ncbi:MAG: hypothetical protein AB1Z98_08075 [Nannocystaceae bacterium]